MKKQFQNEHLNPNDNLFYRAVVEDNNHPNKNGQVKVRIVGVHTSKNENSNEVFANVSTADLPWAEVSGGTAFGLISGVGLSSILKQGTWVWVFLENGDCNKPIVFSTITGTPTVKILYTDGDGFCDPDGKYPLDDRLSESDVNRLARNENLTSPYYKTSPNVYGGLNTVHDTINNNIDAQLSKTDTITGADVSQTEPNSTNENSIYPEVEVIETSSGHVIELDDTATNERIRVYHKSGSYIEIKPDGTFVQKSANTDSASHYIHMSDVNEHIAKSVKRYIELNVDEIINGNLKQHIDKNIRQSIAGALTVTANGNIELKDGVKINGNLYVTGKISSDGDIASAAEISDSVSDLSHVRGQYDSHTHFGNLGIPTSTTSHPDSGGGKQVVNVTVTEV